MSKKSITFATNILYIRIMFTRYVHKILLIALVLTGAGASYVRAAIHQGTCGAPGNEDNVTWKVDTEYQSLVINGTGPMQDYSPTSPAPWASYNSYYDRAAFNTDVTNVGEYAFYNCQNITSVFISSAILSIGRNAFDGCTALRYVNIPSSITSIGEEAFQNCDALQAIYASWTTAGDLPTWTNMTNKNHSTIKLYIPCETASIYEAASGWNNYANMFETPVVDRKTCGPNATYVLSCDSVLTISGTGSMYNSAYVGDNLSIKHVIIEDGITGIGNYIFTYFTNLVSVSIPSSVTSIGYSAFRGCPALTSVTIPSSVTSIGQYAFRDCNNLTDIYVSWTETAKIPTWNNLTNKTPQSDITLHVPCGSADIYEAKANWTDYTIDGGPSGTCGASGDNLTWMLCDSVLTISGTGAMANTWAVATVPWAAYKDEITSVVVNAGVTVIGQYAFAQCANLQSVSFPEGLTAIRGYAFRECSSLTSITIPNSVTLIGTEAFRSTPLEDIYVSWTSSIPTWNSMTDKEASSIKLHIPCGTSANYLAKNGWMKYALRSDCTEEYTLTVQSNAPTLGVVQIDDGEIGVSASLQVKKDETHFIKAFANDACHRFQQWNDVKNDNPRTVNISANTTYTAQFTNQSTLSGACGTYATWVLSCDSVLTISGTGAIWSQAFQNKSYSSAIKHVIIEEGIESIETNAFQGCANLVSVQNPSTLRRIRDYAFMNCQKLDTINFPEGLITIGSSPTSDGHTFYECNSLRSIHIPASLTNISKDCFLRCYNVTSIVVDSANTTYDSRDNCNAIIEKTNNKLWYGCRNTVIPDGVVTIADYAFEYQHNLKSIRISNTVTSFGYYVFKECENLKDIYVEWTENIPNYVITQWQQHLNLDQTIRVHVPCGKAALYEAIYNWNKFQIVDDHVKGGMCGAQGANLTWMLDCSGVLTISGTGAMADFVADADCPWYPYRAQIYTINIGDGVTTIGSKAFVHSNISSITIPNSVTSIGRYAFCYSNYLEEIVLPEGLISIGDHAFYYGNLLKTVHLPATLTSLGVSAFEGCSLLQDLYVSWSSSIPGWPSNFSKTYGVNLHVPCEAIDTYKTKTGWKNYNVVGGVTYTVTVETATGDVTMGTVSITVNP